MAGSVNKVILVGNLGRDPEVRHTQDGKPIVNLSIATSETWRDRNTGERKERTEWHRVVIFNENLAKVAEQYLKKGSTVYVEGQLQTRKYTDNSGVEKYSTEVVLQNFRGELTMLGGRAAGTGVAWVAVVMNSARRRRLSALAPAASRRPFSREFTRWTTKSLSGEHWFLRRCLNFPIVGWLIRLEFAALQHAIS